VSVRERNGRLGHDALAPARRGGRQTDALRILNLPRFIRTVPVLQHDQSRVEDLDTEAEDPAADETRYACMSRPWVAVMLWSSLCTHRDGKRR